MEYVAGRKTKGKKALGMVLTPVAVTCGLIWLVEVGTMNALLVMVGVCVELPAFAPRRVEPVPVLMIPVHDAPLGQQATWPAWSS